VSTVSIAQINGEATKLDSSSLEELKKSLKGELIRPEDSGYDEARSIWNAMIDKRPAFIVRCAGIEDVKKAVIFARDNNLLTAVRGAGHNIAGNAVCDDGIVIDLSQMKSVKVDSKNRVAHVGPGATLGDFDKESQNSRLATPLGINSTTGIAGLTLGGGFGWLSRKYGMTVDNLTGADVVTADGKLLHASADENSDLFWGLTGGGGNFGIVTDFEFRLHPFGTDVFSGLIVFRHQEAVDVLKKYREFVPGLPDETSVWVVLRKAPPLPFVPQEAHGTDILVLAIFHAGDPEEGKKNIEPVRKFGNVLAEHTGVQPYVDWQTAFDPLLAPGARNYWKSHNLSEMSDKAIEIATTYAATMPSPHCEVLLAHLGGAVSRVGVDDTAYPHRNSEFIFNVHGRWENAADDEKCVAWARELHSKMTPLSAGSVYVNFMTEDEGERVPSAFGSSYKRLVELKKKYDPDNFFRLNQNISPN
jgi:FAD/FMN-containing dehydrogenase